MNELFELLSPYIMVILTAIAGYLATKIKLFLDAKIDRVNQERLMGFIALTVDYVEQIGVGLKAEEKFQLAKSKIIIWIRQKGLTVTEDEMDILIEAFVHGLAPTHATTEEIPKEG